MSLETKLKSVSRYWTQYSHFRYEAVSSSSTFATLCSSKSFLRISGTVSFWYMRQVEVRVRNHSHGRTLAWYRWWRPRMPICEKRVT
jgi:hypothetical protein